MLFSASNLIFYFILFTGLYFQIFLLATLIENGGIRKKNEENEGELPTVAITIPCFNEATTLTGTVLSLLAIDYPKDKLQIVLIDDGSTDNTYEVAEKLHLKYPQVRVFHQANGGKFKALNFGLTQTTSEFVGCLDADSYVDKMALRRMIPYFADKKIMAVTPAIKVHNPSNIIQLIQRAEYNIGICLKLILGKINAIHVTPGPFSIFRREVFTTLGNYKHAHNTEDMEIAFRMQANHYKITNCPDAYVYTVTPNTVKKLYRQRVRWIYGFLKNSLDYKFLFMNKKYGNVGLFTLPFSLLFIFTSLYIVGHIVFSFTKYLIQKFIEIRTIGISFHFHPLNFDWFFVNIESITVLAAVLLSISIYFMLKGKKMSEGTMKPGLEMVYFVFLYGFIAPFWLTKAVYNTVLSKDTPWR